MNYAASPFQFKDGDIESLREDLVLPMDMQNLGAEYRMAALFPESQMPRERGAVW